MCGRLDIDERLAIEVGDERRKDRISETPRAFDEQAIFSGGRLRASWFFSTS